MEGESGGDLVDFDHASLDAVGVLHGAFEVAGDDRGGEAGFHAIGDLDGFLEVIDGYHGDHGAEDFFTGDALVGEDVTQDCGGDEVAVREVAFGEGVAAADESCALGLGDLDVVEVGFELGLIDCGAHLGFGVQAVADLDAFGLGDQFFEEEFEYRFFDEHAAGGGAGLAGQAETCFDHERGGEVEVGICQDDGGVFATHFHLGSGHAFSELLMDALADGVGAGEGESAHCGVVGQSATDRFAFADDDIGDARGDAGFYECQADFEAKGRGGGGGFKDGGISCHECGGQFPGGDGDGEIPGCDEAYDAEGLALGIEEDIGEVMGNGLATERVTDAPEEPEDIDGALDFAGGLREGFAFLAGEELGELGLACFQDLRGFGQDAATGDRGGVGPRREGGLGGIDGLLCVLLVTERVLGDRFPGIGGILSLEGLSGGSVCPLAVDKILVGAHGLAV